MSSTIAVWNLLLLLMLFHFLIFLYELFGGFCSFRSYIDVQHQALASLSRALFGYIPAVFALFILLTVTVFTAWTHLIILIFRIHAEICLYLLTILALLLFRSVLFLNISWCFIECCIIFGFCLFQLELLLVLVDLSLQITFDLVEVGLAFYAYVTLTTAEVTSHKNWVEVVLLC